MSLKRRLAGAGAGLQIPLMGSTSIRDVARLVLLDANGSILLVRYDDGQPGRPPSYWATPGGSLEDGEDHRDAAARELLEETGLRVKVGRELWQRSFDIDHGNGTVQQVERFFLVRVNAVAPAVANSSSEAIREHRWWSLDDLKATQEVIFPDGLADSLATITPR
jgi:8-oxo-dGTP pyrophosphatase MutT (NUDIX family)